MLILRIHNDGTGNVDTASYNILVDVTLSPEVLKPIARCRIENYQRGDGWLALMKKAVEALERGDVVK